MNIKKLLPQTLGGRCDNYLNVAIENAKEALFHHNRFLFKVLADACWGQEQVRIMEIGTYNGNTAKKMIETAQRTGVKDIEYYGTDLFEKPPDYEVRFLNAGWLPSEKVKAKLERTGAKIFLMKGNTRDTLPREVLNLPKMNFIYIDGGHSYETAKSDWTNAKKLMHEKTVVVFDDYWGFGGVRRVVDEIGDGFNVGLTRRRAIVRANSSGQKSVILPNAGYISGHHAHEELASSVSRNRYEIPARDERSWISYFLDVLPRAWGIPRHDVLINEGGRTLPLVFLKAVLRRRFVHIVRSNDMFFDFGALPWHKRLVLKFTARYIDGVIAVSDMIEECVRKNTSLPARKVNTFVKDDYLEIQPDLSARNIIAIGTRYPQKGNDILAEIDKRLRERGYRGETFVLGRERAPEFIKDYSRNQPHFHLTGFVDNLKDYLAKGCFYVHPARFDAAGCSVVEAMAAGLIPIVSERTGNKEVVNKVDPGLVLENTPESFCRKLSDLMELSEPELIVLSDRAKEVASAYTFDKIKEEFRGAVRKLMHDIEGRRHAG